MNRKNNNKKDGSDEGFNIKNYLPKEGSAQYYYSSDNPQYPRADLRHINNNYGLLNNNLTVSPSFVGGNLNGNLGLISDLNNIDSPKLNFVSSTLSKEDVSEMIKNANKDGLTEDKVAKLIEEIEAKKQSQKTEMISDEIRKAVEYSKKELLQGKTKDWHCAKCRAPLDNFNGEEGIGKINQYLMNFRDNIFKKCKNGHENWFEFRSGSIVLMTRVILERDFDEKKIDTF